MGASFDLNQGRHGEYHAFEAALPVFADTFYWIALTNPADLHSEAARAFDDLLSGGQVTTTEEVLTELLAFLAGITDSRQPS